MEKFLVTLPDRITAVVYRDIHKQKLISFLNKIGRHHRYQQDNAPVHTVCVCFILRPLARPSAYRERTVGSY